tara:strand:+ start:1781 stop:2527 length:747 start_codon:yes stop_codon:yes gene_type:complete
MNKLKTVFWDLDGTIADTELSGHRVAFNKAFEDYSLGWNWDIQTYKDLLKISGGKKRIKYFALNNNTQIDKHIINKIHFTKQMYYREIISNGKIPLRNGVQRLLSDLNKNNISQYLVTTSSYNGAISLLKKCVYQYDNIFSGFITYEDVQNHKPHPEAYLKALSLSNFRINNCLVIEDSEIGLESSIRAELKCLITVSPWTDYKSNRFVGAEAVVSSLGTFEEESICYRGKSLLEKFVCLNYLESILN